MNSRQKNIIAALSIVAGFVVFSCTAYGIHRYQQNKAENAIRAGQIVTADDGTVQIRTRFYNLTCPSDWDGRIAVETVPVEETYSGNPIFARYYEPDISPDNYSLILYYQPSGSDIREKAAEFRMYAYLQDCQSLDDWDYIGKIEYYHHWKDDYDDCKAQIILLYPEESDTAAADPACQEIREALSAVAESLEPRSSFVLDHEQNDRVYWDKNSDKDDHGMTWKEYEEREYESIRRELERKKAKNSSSSGSSSRSGSSYGSGSSSGSSRSSGSRSYYYDSDPYDVEEYDNPDDFADEWVDEFNEDGDDEDEAWDEAYDYWEENH